MNYLRWKLQGMIVSGGVPYKTITIDHTKVDATLTDYPVMVKLLDANFDFTTVRSDGLDIAFYDNSDNLLAFEMEYFTKTGTNQGVFHVKVPSVSSSADTTFKMVYGNGEAADLSNKTGVWDANFMTVLHMGSSLNDSTSNANNGTDAGTSAVSGLNGQGRSFDGTNDYIMLTRNNGEIDVLEETTITFLFNPTTVSTERLWYGGGLGETGKEQLFSRSLSNIITISYDSPTRKVIFTDTAANYGVQTSAYNLFSFKFSKTGDNAKYFNNSTQNNSSTLSIATSAENTSNFYIGKDNRNAAYFSGIFDEFRISNVARSDAWIIADDYNLRLNTLVSIS